MLRKEKNLTLEQFGAKIGISGPALSQIESGKNNPSNSTIIGVCREFGVNETWLRTGNGDTHQAEGDAELFSAWAGRHLSEESSEFKRRFMRVIMNMSESEWELLYKKLEKMFDGLKNPPDGD